MAGNTRGKLKEHFEGIHKNLDWSLNHIQKSLALIAGQLQFTDDMVQAQGDKEKEQAVLNAHPLYNGLTSLGLGVQTLDGFVKDLFNTL